MQGNMIICDQGSDLPFSISDNITYLHFHDRIITQLVTPPFLSQTVTLHQMSSKEQYTV